MERIGQRRLAALAAALIVGVFVSLAWAQPGHAATTKCAGGTCLTVDDSSTDPIQPSNSAAGVATFIDYKLTVQNNTSATVENIDIKFTIPGSTYGDPRCRVTGSQVTCRLQSVGAGQSKTLHVAVQTPDRASASLPATVTNSFNAIWKGNQTGVTASESTTVQDSSGRGSSWVLPNTYVKITTDGLGRGAASAGDTQIAELTIFPQAGLLEGFLAQIEETAQVEPFAPCAPVVSTLSASCGLGTWVKIDANPGATYSFDPALLIEANYDSSTVRDLPTEDARIAYSQEQPYNGQCIVREEDGSADDGCIHIISRICEPADSVSTPCFTLTRVAGTGDDREGDWEFDLRRRTNGYMRALGICIPPTVGGIQVGPSC